jgi:hypothetical protein
VIASWSHGKISLHVGMVRPEDKAERPGKGTGAPSDKGAADGDEITYPASLTEDLKTERAMALGAAMTMHPEATLDLTLFKLVTDVLTSGMGVTHPDHPGHRRDLRREHAAGAAGQCRHQALPHALGRKDRRGVEQGRGQDHQDRGHPFPRGREEPVRGSQPV